MKIFKVIFIASLLLIPFGEILRFNITKDVAIKPLDIGIGLTALLFIIFFRKNANFLQKSFIRPIILFIGIAIFSLLINSHSLNQVQFIAAGLYLTRWISYVIIYVAVASFDEKVKNNICKILLFDGAIILLLGYIQFILYPNLRNLYYLGWDEHNYRMFSVFLDPNFAGAFFVLFFLFMVGLLHGLLLNNNSGKHSALLISTGFHQSDSGQARMTAISLYILVLITTITAIFLTYSRSALLMLLVSSISYLVLINKKKLVFALISSIALVLLLLSPTFNKENTNPFRITSSLARLDSYSKAISIIRSHPLFGVGFNAYRYAHITPYNSKLTPSVYENHAEAGSDSSLLFIAATTGLVGLAAYLYMWFSILKRAFYLYYKKSNRIALVVICSSIGLFVNSIFINSLFFPPIMLWMWILIGLMEE